ncbi:MAG: methyltransferase [Paracoccaceae bacterium]
MSDPMALLAGPFEDGLLARPEGTVAVLRARPSASLAGWDLVCEQGFRPDHDRLLAEGRRVEPQLSPDAGPFAAAAALATRSRDETRANLARAWDLAAEGAPVILAGAKTDGVEGHQRALRRAVAPLGLEVEALPRGHGRAVWTRRRGAAPAVFAEWIEAAAPARRVEAFGRGFLTVAGAFSWDGVDPGSALLAEALPALSGCVADLGAGWGFLAAAALRSPEVERLDLVEAERTVLDCAEANLAGDARAAFHWADATDPPLPEGAFDAVIANPPFHAGRRAEPAVGAAFLASAARLLAPRGVLWAVANRQLPYERTLAERFAEAEEIGGDKTYKLLRARRPRPPRRR